jgi:hypothetical protein
MAGLVLHCQKNEPAKTMAIASAFKNGMILTAEKIGF